MAEVLEGIGYVKAKGNGSGICLSTRPVSFSTKPEVEVYRLANNARVMLYGEHERSKKRLKARQLTYQKVQQVHQPSFNKHFSKILELM